MPLKLEPYRHENEQFGYLPEYPLDNQVYFDVENRPFIVSGDGVLHLTGPKPRRHVVLMPATLLHLDPSAPR